MRTYDAMVLNDKAKSAVEPAIFVGWSLRVEDNKVSLVVTYEELTTDNRYEKKERIIDL